MPLRPTNEDQPERAVLSALAGKRLTPDALNRLLGIRGLYAVYGAASTWAELGLAEPDGRPLYVGKADNLGRRLPKSHFCDVDAATRDTDESPTGQSTLRRALAALLRGPLALSAVPRTLPAKPSDIRNYALPLDGDRALTRWMAARLTVAAWEAPDDARPNDDLEPPIIRHLLPPLNDTYSASPWRPQLRRARKAMRDEARRCAGSEL